MNSQSNVKKYLISVTQENEKIAVARAHGVSLRMSMHGPDPALGFTAPETLIAAYGACLMTNIGKAAKKLTVSIKNPRIDFTAIKNNEPLGIKNVGCAITVESTEPAEKVTAMLEKATSDGTATNAIHEGIRAAFTFVIE